VAKKSNRNRVPEYHIKDSEFRSAVAAARTAYMVRNDGLAPTIEEVNAVCEVPMHRLGRILSSEEFNVLMTASGIPWKRVKGLSTEQNYMLLILSNPQEKRSFEQCLRDAGVTWTTYKSWMRQPLFSGIIKQLSSQALGDHETVANNALMKKVETGDVRALEFYYRMTGIYDPNATQERDMQSVVAGIVDIMQRNIKDPDLLKIIAGEIKTLMSGGRPGAGEISGSYREEQDIVEADEIVEEQVSDLVPERTIIFTNFEEYKESSDPQPIVNIIPPVARERKRLTLDLNNQE
jgi:hypothetical protein